MKYYIILILLVVLAFANSIQNSFVWDDYLMIVDNPRIDLAPKEMLSLFTMPLSKFTGYPEHLQVYYRPVLFLYFILNYKIWGMNPAGFHLANILIYITTVLVLYRAGLHLFDRQENSKLTSLIGASVFAVHPVNSEMAGRAASGEILFGFFILLSLYFFLKERKYLSLFTFALALLSKEPAVMFPFALVILAIDKKGIKKGISTMMPYIMLIGSYFILRTITVDTVLGSEITQPVFTRIITMSVAIFDYTKSFVLPYPLKLFYPAEWHTSLSEPKVILAIATLIAISFSVYKLRKDKVMLFLLLAPYIMLIPVIWRVNTLPVGSNLSSISNRFLYVSIMPFSLFAAAMAQRLFKGYTKKYLVAGCLSVIIILTALTALSNRDWGNNITFFGKIIEQSPNTEFARIGLGNAYKEAGRLDEAMREWQIALQINPNQIELFNAVGNIYFLRGDYEKAINMYETAFIKGSQTVELYYNLALSLESVGKKDKASVYYREFIKIAPAQYKDIVSELKIRLGNSK